MLAGLLRPEEAHHHAGLESGRMRCVHCSGPICYQTDRTFLRVEPTLRNNRQELQGEKLDSGAITGSWGKPYLSPTITLDFPIKITNKFLIGLNQVRLLFCRFTTERVLTLFIIINISITFQSIDIVSYDSFCPTHSQTEFPENSNQHDLLLHGTSRNTDGSWHRSWPP